MLDYRSVWTNLECKIDQQKHKVFLQVDEFYGALLEGRSGVSLIEGFDAGDFSTRIAGEIKEFSGDGYIDKRAERRLDSFLKYAIVAGKKVGTAVLECECPASLSPDCMCG